MADLLHSLIKAIRSGEITRQENVPAFLGEQWRQMAGFLSLRALEIHPKGNIEKSGSEFSGELLILDKFGIGECVCPFDQNTQTNNPNSLVLIKLEKAKEIQD